MRLVAHLEPVSPRDPHLPSTMCDYDGEKQSKHVEIVIIGAGMAGLSAAKHLMKNGRSDFLILEARNRIGGRIISIDVGSQKVSVT